MEKNFSFKVNTEKDKNDRMEPFLELIKEIDQVNLDLDYFLSVSNRLMTFSNDLNCISDDIIENTIEKYDIVNRLCEMIESFSNSEFICYNLFVTLKNIIIKIYSAKNIFSRNLEEILLKYQPNESMRPIVIDIIESLCGSKNGAIFVLKSDLFRFIMDISFELLFQLKSDFNIYSNKITMVNKFLNIIKHIIEQIPEDIEKYIEVFFELLNNAFDSQHSYNFEKLGIEILIKLVKSNYGEYVYHSGILLNIFSFLSNETDRIVITYIIKLINIYLSEELIPIDEFEKLIPLNEITYCFIKFNQNDYELTQNSLLFFNNIIRNEIINISFFLDNNDFMDSIILILKESGNIIRKNGLNLIWDFIYYGTNEQKLMIVDSPLFDFLVDSFYLDEPSFYIETILKSFREVLNMYIINDKTNENSFKRIENEIVPILVEMSLSDNEEISKHSYQILYDFFPETI